MVWLVVRECLSVVASGLAIGIPAALALAGVMRSVLYGLKPTDVVSYTAGILLMILVSAFAAWLPARRAALIQPFTALKYE